MLSDSLNQESVDLEVLRNLADAQGEDDLDLVVELIDLYLVDVERRVIAMLDALEKCDGLSLDRAAHALKGSSATLGISLVAQLCEELEMLARAEELKKAGEVTQRLQAECATVKKLLLVEREFRLSAGAESSELLMPA